MWSPILIISVEFEGPVARQFDACFALKMEAPTLKRERIAKKIAWIIERQSRGAADYRQHERIFPRRSSVILSTEEGRHFPATLIDVSLPGASLMIDPAPPVGSQVKVGQTSARVVRQFEGGVAVTFDNALTSDVLNEDVIL